MKKLFFLCLLITNAPNYCMANKTAQSMARKAAVRHSKQEIRRANYDRIFIDKKNPMTNKTQLLRTFHLKFPSILGGHHLDPVSDYKELNSYFQRSRSLNQMLILHACSPSGQNLINDLGKEGYKIKHPELANGMTAMNSVFFEPLVMASIRCILYQNDGISPELIKVMTNKSFDGAVQIGLDSQFDFIKLSKFHDDIAFIEVGIPEENEKII